MNDNTEALPPLPEQEQFEAWAQDSFGPLQRDDRLVYLYTDVRAAWRAWQARAALAQRQQVPGGWQLVPKAPTKEMIEAGRWSEYGESSPRPLPVSDEAVIVVWVSMLVAAPALTAAPSAQAEPQEPPAWMSAVRGVRVDGDSVVIKAKGGNDAARWLCGEILQHGIGKQEGK